MEIGFQLLFSTVRSTPIVFEFAQTCVTTFASFFLSSFYSSQVHLNNFGSTMLNYKLRIYRSNNMIRSKNKQIDSVFIWIQKNHDLNTMAILLPFFHFWFLRIRNFKSMSIITVDYLFLKVLTTTTQRVKEKLHHLGLLSDSRLCKFCGKRNDGKVKSEKKRNFCCYYY